MDPLEKEHLRRRIADRMDAFAGGNGSVTCISGHVYDDEARPCELCQLAHANEILVIRNRAGRKLHAAVPCLLEVVRFQIAEVEDLPRWIEKIKLLRHAAEARRSRTTAEREEEKRRLEKRVIVRRRSIEKA